MPSDSQNGNSKDDKSTLKEPDWYVVVWDKNQKGLGQVGPMGWAIVGIICALLLVTIIIVALERGLDRIEDVPDGEDASAEGGGLFSEDGEWLGD